MVETIINKFCIDNGLPTIKIGKLASNDNKINKEVELDNNDITDKGHESKINLNRKMSNKSIKMMKS